MAKIVLILFLINKTFELNMKKYFKEKSDISTFGGSL